MQIYMYNLWKLYKKKNNEITSQSKVNKHI